jgi:hypothetical protein
MSPAREIDEEVARCVAAIVFYHNSPRSKQSEGVLTKDVRQVAVWASNAKLGKLEAGQLLFESIRAGLVLRYGDDVGNSLFMDFLTAYERVFRSVHRAAAQNGQSLTLTMPTAV